MSAGTITLTNNSVTVTGSGTTFTGIGTGDFIVATVGGITYTLPVSSVDSATKITLASAYTGPTQSGLAWDAVPRATMNKVTAELVAQITQALRGLNYDKTNWQQVYSVAGNITVRLPDGSMFTGPSWNAVVSSVAGKVDKGGSTMTGALTLPSLEVTAATPFIDFHFNNANRDFDVRVINDWTNQLRIVGGTGAATLQVDGSVRSYNLYVASPITGVQATSPGGFLDHAGDRTRLLNQPGGGAGGFSMTAMTAAGVDKCTWNFNVDGGIAGPLGGVQWFTSDRGMKQNIEDIKGGEDASLERIMKMRAYEFEWKSSGKRDRGFIAQEMLAIDERYANYTFKEYDENNDANDLSGEKEGLYGLSDRAIMADAIAVIQMQQREIETLKSNLKELKEIVDGLIAE